MGILEQQQLEDGRWRQQVDATLDVHRDLLADFEAKFNRGNARFAEGEARMTRLETLLGDNNTMTASVQTSMGTLTTDLSTLKSDTSLLVTWMKNAIGFRNVMTALAAFVLWLSVFLIALGVVWFVATQHRLPEPKRTDLGVFLGAVVPLRRRAYPVGLACAGYPRPASPVTVFAEDFSTLIRTPRRIRTDPTKQRVIVIS